VQDLKELYGEVITEHGKKPRNYRAIEGANRRAEGYNPLCGDHLLLYADVHDGVIRDISFLGDGCRIFKAASSMMTHRLKGKSRDEAKLLADEFHRMIMGELDAENTPNQLGHLKAFSGVCNFPVRVKCASLPWRTLEAALEGEETATTENIGPALVETEAD
jgi:nitrogen fixation protein NifU and related proteins